MTIIENGNIDSEEENWRVRLNALEKEYYDLRHNLYSAIERYYRQNPYGDYVTEDRLIEQLEKLKKLRDSMKKISLDNYPNTSGSNYRPAIFPRYGKFADITC